jgi:molybdopterin molybdotransferase
MISVSEATDIILSNTMDFGSAELALADAIGRVLDQDITADRDFPPFTRVTMDGIAIQYQAYEAGKRSFPIMGMQAAGQTQQPLTDPNGCLEVMTGAILPLNTDTIIRYEDVDIRDQQAFIIEGAKVKAGQNAHTKGSDRRQGEVLIKKGRIITAAEIGVAATVGLARPMVKGLPKVALISTGDELVGIEEQPAPHQIRSSNIPSLNGLFHRWGIPAESFHLPDDLAATQTLLARLLDTFDVLVLSGGVSKGKFDYIPLAMENLGVKKCFHRIKQRPGKPFWFGVAKDNTVVFALPGNPVSSFMCTTRYVQPWLRKSWGLEPFQSAYATLTDDFTFAPDLTYFLQVKTSYEPASGRLMASPIVGRGSGDLANLVNADAFLELPRTASHFTAGSTYPIHFYR